jgi:hypothetical protein
VDRSISQRELRNDSGKIMRALGDGETFVVTRHGAPVGELRPLRRQRFVAAQAAVELFRGAPSVDMARLRSDLDAAVEVAICAITLAELAAGPHASGNRDEASRRQDRLQRAEAAFDPITFDANAARAYGRVFAAVVEADRKARGARAVDLLVAATALAVELPVYTRNGADFAGIDRLVDVVEI